jgi:hypothetical protein
MHKSEHRALTSAEVCEVAGCTPRQLQSFLELCPLEPVVKGSKGRGCSHGYSLWQCVCVAYGRACLEAGCHHDYAYRVVKWLAGQYPRVVAPLARGETLVSLTPTGEGRMVKPDPAADRKEKLAAAKLDLLCVHQTVLNKVMRLAESQAVGEKARAQARGRK